MPTNLMFLPIVAVSAANKDTGQLTVLFVVVLVPLHHEEWWNKSVNVILVIHATAIHATVIHAIVIHAIVIHAIVIHAIVIHAIVIHAIVIHAIVIHATDRLRRKFHAQFPMTMSVESATFLVIGWKTVLSMHLKG